MFGWVNKFKFKFN